MKQQIRRAVKQVIVFAAINAPAGRGRLAATQAISALSTEVAGPLAYGFSLIAIVGTAVSWYRHHHDRGHLRKEEWAHSSRAAWH
jgi:hypothetical protein